MIHRVKDSTRRMYIGSLKLIMLLTISSKAQPLKLQTMFCNEFSFVRWAFSVCVTQKHTIRKTNINVRLNANFTARFGVFFLEKLNSRAHTHNIDSCTVSISSQGYSRPIAMQYTDYNYSAIVASLSTVTHTEKTKRTFSCEIIQGRVDPNQIVMHLICAYICQKISHTCICATKHCFISTISDEKFSIHVHVCICIDLMSVPCSVIQMLVQTK